MFRHKGTARTLQHNIRLASLLSFVAGMVNASGFIAFSRLTTNVTGHFAYLIYEVFQSAWAYALLFLFFIICFFLGSFISNVLIEFYHKRSGSYVYAAPVMLEALVLIACCLLGHELIHQNPDVLASMLLFAMGIQNALVTKISNAAVRTTHLTGLFTDLGIDLSQLLFNPLPEQKRRLFGSIKLRLTIITFFFVGGLVGGFMYYTIYLNSLVLAALILLGGVSYDYFKYRILVRKRKLQE